MADQIKTLIAQVLRGKNKPTFTPHMDGGDFVIVVNASKVKLTGRKVSNKKYFKHTGYMGHESFTTARAYGVEVTVLERDAAPVPESADEALLEDRGHRGAQGRTEASP